MLNAKIHIHIGTHKPTIGVHLIRQALHHYIIGVISQAYAYASKINGLPIHNKKSMTESWFGYAVDVAQTVYLLIGNDKS